MQTAPLNPSLTEGWALTRGGGGQFFFNKNKRGFPSFTIQKNHRISDQEVFVSCFSSHFFHVRCAQLHAGLWKHSDTLSLKCMHPYSYTSLSLSLSPSSLLFHPSTYAGLSSLLFFSPVPSTFPPWLSLAGPRVQRRAGSRM